MTMMPSFRLRVLPGLRGLDGKTVEMQADPNYIQWRNVGDTAWINIVAKSELKGDQGVPGPPGADGGGVPAGGSPGQVLGYGNGVIRAWQNAGAGDVLAVNNANDFLSKPDVRNNLIIPTRASTRAAVKALNGTKDPLVYLFESGRNGMFLWDASVLIATHQADTLEGIYLAPNPAANGAFVRIYSGTVWAEWFGAVGHKTDTAALAGGAASSTAAIQAAVLMLRKSARALTNDGLTGKAITTYATGTVRFGDGIFIIEPDVLRFTQENGLVFQGNGSRGKTNYMRAPTTILVKGASSGYGIQWYSNGARDGGLRDLDVCYESASFTGDVVQFIGAPGCYPERCMIGTFGIGTVDAPRRQTARSCIAIAWDEFFNPKETVFDGAVRAILSDDTRTLAAFTGSISTTTLTVTAIASGSLGPDVTIYGSGVTAGTVIVSQLTSTEPGGALQGRGTYQISASQTVASTAMTADIGFGGSNTHIQNCVFYDLTSKHFAHAGNRRRLNFFITQSTANPISMNVGNSIDLRNVRGFGIEDVHFVGSVGNIATGGWLYIDQSVGYVRGCNFMDPGGTACFVGTLNGEIEFSNNVCQASNGLNLTGGVIRGGANRWLLAAVAWATTPLETLHLDLGSDTFEGGPTAVGKSYDINLNGGNAITGSIQYAANKDNSTSKFENDATGVFFEGRGTKSIGTAGSTTMVITDTGRTIYAAGANPQTFALPSATPGVRFKITKVASAQLTITAPGGTPFYNGDATVKTSAVNAASTTGATIIIEPVGTSGWSIISTIGGWTYS